MKQAFSILTDGDFTFEEAARFFRNKVPVTASVFRKLGRKYKHLAFTVSGYTKAEILNAFYNTLLAAIEDGTTKERFQKDMDGFLQDKGYEGLTNFQAENIFQTNIQTAYHVGHYERMTDPDVVRLRSYWIYDAVEDDRTRPVHQAMNGRVFPADSPVWDTWYPPNGFKCRCGVRTLSKRQVEQRGLRVETELPDRVELGGSLIPMQPDSGFQRNPAKHPFQPDMDGYPEPLKKAYEKRNARRVQEDA